MLFALFLICILVITTWFLQMIFWISFIINAPYTSYETKSSLESLDADLSCLNKLDWYATCCLISSPVVTYIYISGKDIDGQIGSKSNAIWQIKIYVKQLSRAHRNPAYKPRFLKTKKSKRRQSCTGSVKGEGRCAKWNFEFIEIEIKAYKEVFPRQSFYL